MARRDSHIEVTGYIDAQYSSGDSNRNTKCQEENNNDVDELSKCVSDVAIEEMGCIVDAVKRPPNICVETCVYESSDDEKETKTDDKEDVYSDEFEEDKSDGESEKTEEKTVTGSVSKDSQSTKVSKSQMSVSSKAPSISGKTDFGSSSIHTTRRVNMSFTNDRLREIERHNHILLTKILSARNQRKSSIPPREPPIRKPMSSAAVMRKKQQRQIDHDNMILLKKIQRAKSSSYSLRR
ncbi:cilia- and flagella-associated protein 97-like [Plodia interpunctella]|uniref:cilia- and flagella-associated protein 97-like n=1 Tax=Plodia interpunctella TaxID=58824 RepID=UPI0023689410|nr:cilia- and flagella-associated protein 97-like [Plodia interpunctella]XP_053616601.1 cilia- and flagella-associated protein 97-like [Plodia interpunctella]XP_053616602.1 cilia- and flagella-associated protein 97-like [Plodia interpunctella]XP_053616603.1 cilia- and flagella-associated protein 97-like [Plodia interpunctella]